MATTVEEIPAPAPPPEHHSVAQALALLRPWIDVVPRPQRRLGIFIFLALLAHLTAFFFIRIDATRAELQHQPRTHVTMEDPRTETEGDDAFWDRLTDPRLFLLPVGPLPNLSSDEPRLAFSAINTSLSTPTFPAAALADRYPATTAVPSVSQEVSDDLFPARQPFSYDETSPAVSPHTTWQWDKTLAARQPSNIPGLPSPVSDTDLSPSKLLVGIGADGTVQHVLLEDTSQKPELDQQAILAARKIMFRPVDQPGVTWGRMTVSWRYTPTPRDVVVPTPPSP